jgi:hypothetical protein
MKKSSELHMRQEKKKKGVFPKGNCSKSHALRHLWLKTLPQQ